MKKAIKKILALVLSCCILATLIAIPVTVQAESDDLRFDTDGKFKIVIFSDAQD